MSIGEVSIGMRKEKESSVLSEQLISCNTSHLSKNACAFLLRCEVPWYIRDFASGKTEHISTIPVTTTGHYQSITINAMYKLTGKSQVGH